MGNLIKKSVCCCHGGEDEFQGCFETIRSRILGNKTDFHAKHPGKQSSNSPNDLVPTEFVPVNIPLSSKSMHMTSSAVRGHGSAHNTSYLRKENASEFAGGGGRVSAVDVSHDMHPN